MRLRRILEHACIILLSSEKQPQIHLSPSSNGIEMNSHTYML